MYAGAYAFGRRTARVTIENGRKRVVRSMQRDWRSWEVLIRDHHERYISWAEFERNQQLIADNANGKRFMSRGAIRPGEALLPGLLRCARCGKKLRVRYGQTYRYECAGAFNHLAAARCITFGGMRIDRVGSAHRALGVLNRNCGCIPNVAPRKNAAVGPLRGHLPFPLVRKALAGPLGIGPCIFE